MGEGTDNRWKVVGLEKVQADQNREWLLLALWTKRDRLSDARVLIFLLKQCFQSFVIWYLLCRVFLCTLLITRNKHVYSKVDGDLLLNESSCNPVRCMEDPLQILSSLCNCVRTFSKSMHFYHLHCIDQHFLNHFLPWLMIQSALHYSAYNLKSSFYTACLGICCLGRDY